MAGPTRNTLTLGTIGLALAAQSPSFAQEEAGATSTPEGVNVTVQMPPPTTTTTQSAPGYPQPGADLEGHLPSSSKAISDTGASQDGFDLNQGAAGAVSVKGGENGQYVLEGSYVPEMHTVRRGETLWGISGNYYSSSYNWPRIWSYNPQIQNPHWIYPGDRVRLRGERSIGDSPQVPPRTVFLRDLGWVDDPEEDTWGQLVGAPDDQMMLSYGDDAYIELDLDQNRPVNVGDNLTIFRPLRKLGDTDDGDDELVAVRGTARVDRINRDTGMVRAEIVESLDVIERGDLVGQIQRRFTVTPPTRADRDIEARIVAAIYPHVYFGKEQVVFLDKGAEHGVKPGNRFFAIRRGDRWERSLKDADEYASMRALVHDDRPARVDQIPLDGDEDYYPDETYAELRVISVRPNASMAIVMASQYEVQRDAYLIAIEGY